MTRTRGAAAGAYRGGAGGAVWEDALLGRAPRDLIHLVRHLLLPDKPGVCTCVSLLSAALPRRTRALSSPARSTRKRYGQDASFTVLSRLLVLSRLGNLSSRTRKRYGQDASFMVLSRIEEFRISGSVSSSRVPYLSSRTDRKRLSRACLLSRLPGDPAEPGPRWRSRAAVDLASADAALEAHERQSIWRRPIRARPTTWLVRVASTSTWPLAARRPGTPLLVSSANNIQPLAARRPGGVATHTAAHALCRNC